MPGLELFLIIILSLFWLQLIVLPHWNQCIKGFITHSVSNFSNKPITEKACSASTEVGSTVFRALNSKSRYFQVNVMKFQMLYERRCTLSHFQYTKAIFTLCETIFFVSQKVFPCRTFHSARVNLRKISWII